MRVYIEKMKPGAQSNINLYTAIEGFIQMGFEVIMVNSFREVNKHDTDSVVLGSINFVRTVLLDRGQPYPTAFDYPDELTAYLGRDLWVSSVNKVKADEAMRNVFIKPRGYSKKFTGRLVQSDADFADIYNPFADTPVWVSERIDFITEWRVFVRYGKILGVRYYKGDWRKTFDAKVIEQAVADFHSAPNGYAIDFGVTKNGDTLLVEANDGYSLGCYGLNAIDYAKLLSARWAQLSETADLCDFDRVRLVASI